MQTLAGFLSTCGCQVETACCVALVRLCSLQLGDRLKTRDELRAEWEAFQTKQKKVRGLHRVRSCRS